MPHRAYYYAVTALLSGVTLLLFTLETWVVGVYQLGIFLVTFLLAWRGAPGSAFIPAKSVLAVIGLGIGWICLQIVAHTTIYSRATWDLAGYWVTAWCLVFLGARLGRHSQGRDFLLRFSIILTLALGVVGTISFFTSEGKFYWIFPSGYPAVFGPFAYRNYYVNLAELVLPVTVVFAFLERDRWPVYALAVGVMYSAVIATASRSGALLLTAELLVLIFLAPRLSRATRNSRRSVFSGIGVMIVLFTVVAGYDLIVTRFQLDDLYHIRREYLLSSIEMVKDRPVMGFGLGTWTIAYPEYALLDQGTFANHAHNEWVQWAAEGGIPFLLLMLAILVLSIRPAIQTVWGIGVLAVYVHAWADYPFFRLGLASWTFLFLGMLHAAVERRPSHTPSPNMEE